MFRAIMFHIGVSTKHPPLPEPGQLSEIGIDFIELCLTLEAARRPTAVELLQHPWLQPMQQQLSAHNSAGQSSTAGSIASTNMLSIRSHGYTPETGMTPDTEPAGFHTEGPKSEKTSQDEVAAMQKYETAQGSAIEVCVTHDNRCYHT
jgi:serine/threonine protein kinase